MNVEHPFTIFPLGDSALVLSFGNVIDESVNKKTLCIFHKIKMLSIKGIKDVVPAYSSVAIHFDAGIVKQNGTVNKTAFEIMSDEIKKICEEYVYENNSLLISRKIKVPVCYEEKYALDMKEISLEKKLSPEEIIGLHTSKKYKVYMIGFLPGFAYMGDVDERIAMPRKPQPRLKVAQGSVGIAGKQTGIYSLDSPGGWQIIGKTPLILFNKEKTNPVLFQPGDEIEFYSISEDEFTNY